jgi:hypothetical protein
MGDPISDGVGRAGLLDDLVLDLKGLVYKANTGGLRYHIDNPLLLVHICITNPFIPRL